MMRVLRTRWLLVGILLGVLVTPATSQPQCPDPQLYALLPHDYPNGAWVHGVCVR